MSDVSRILALDSPIQLTIRTDAHAQTLAHCEL